MTFASIFSGGGGADIGAIQAGLKTLWGIEYDPAIAESHQYNIPGKTIVSDVYDIDFSSLKFPDVLWASPPCQAFSSTNPARGETPQSINMAKSVCRAIEVIKPSYFFLENVRLYVKSDSFEMIKNTLSLNGYSFIYKSVNSENFGVPQTRHRLILVARKNGEVPEIVQNESRTSWYKAISNIEDTLPSSSFTLRQLELIPESLNRRRLSSNLQNKNIDRYLVDGTLNCRGTKITTKLEWEPSFTLCSGHKTVRAYLCGKVVRLHSRALARLMTFPDSYILPATERLSVKILGNAVPPLMAQKLIQNALDLT